MDNEIPLFIVRIRMDIIIKKNILEIIDLFENDKELQLCCSWDFMGVGKPDIMNVYCSGLEKNYGKYIFNTPVPNELPIMKDYHYLERGRWTYAPERQLFEMLYEYCYNNGLDVNKTITSIDYTGIIR
jgi:hypothetical protein